MLGMCSEQSKWLYVVKPSSICLADSPSILADDMVGAELLDMLARKLGHDDLVIVSRALNELPRQFAAKSETSRWYALRSREWWTLVPVVAMDGCALGCGSGAGYADAARDVHRRLENGEWLMADGKKFKAEDVPEFMIKCTLHGLA